MPTITDLKNFFLDFSNYLESDEKEHYIYRFHWGLCANWQVFCDFHGIELDAKILDDMFIALGYNSGAYPFNDSFMDYRNESIIEKLYENDNRLAFIATMVNSDLSSLDKLLNY